MTYILNIERHKAEAALENYKSQTRHTFSQLVPLKSNIRITSNSKHRNERRAISVQSAFCHCFLECSEWDKMDG
jgi:hypothetical protein